MLMKPLNALLICVLSAALFSCIYEHFDYRLTLINKTRGKIATEVYDDTIPDYPSVNLREVYLGRAIAPDSSATKMQWGKEGWPDYLKRSKNGKLNLVVFDYEDIEKSKSIDSITAHKKYRKITVSRSELFINNWHVVIK